MPALNSFKRNIAEYLSGYVDGEGCFSVSFSRRAKLLVGWETKPSFSISQNQDRAEVIKMIQKFLECGFIRRDYSDRTLKLEVRSINDLVKKVIPHFQKYPLISSKRKDFEYFSKICVMVARRKHLNKNGLRKIVQIAYKMNPSGKRKYKQGDILKGLN
ncbi:LAGLIDADG family homing endonuclease [Patescibacteria group bacterium]|nr:LAGLIDADG family homing endonuclease [Patescibacteria group bacterium]